MGEDRETGSVMTRNSGIRKQRKKRNGEYLRKNNLSFRTNHYDPTAGFTLF